MSDLAATNCGSGCGCGSREGGCGWILPLILIFSCCGGGSGLSNMFGGDDCGSGCGCSSIIWILLLLCCCGGGF